MRTAAASAVAIATGMRRCRCRPDPALFGAGAAAPAQCEVGEAEADEPSYDEDLHDLWPLPGVRRQEVSPWAPPRSKRASPLIPGPRCVVYRGGGATPPPSTGLKRHHPLGGVDPTGAWAPVHVAVTVTKLGMRQVAPPTSGCFRPDRRCPLSSDLEHASSGCSEWVWGPRNAPEPWIKDFGERRQFIDKLIGRRNWHMAVTPTSGAVSHRRRWSFAQPKRFPLSANAGTMTPMGTKSKLQIETGQLASAAGKASQTLAASAVQAIPPPPPTVTSQLDAALALVATSSEALRVDVDATGQRLWATKQQAALTESPPVLTQQDQQGAQDYNRDATQLPTPVMTPGSTGKVYTI